MLKMKILSNLLMMTAALATGFVLVGCDQKEKVVDVNTPDGGVEVERSTDTGAISIDVGE